VREKIALTGGIACGKSLLSRFLNELGVETLDADDVVHELIPDPAERRRIAAEVFADPAKRRELEARIHPVVKARIEEWLEGETSGRSGTSGRSATSGMILPQVTQLPQVPLSSTPNLRIAIIPLLFEVHWEENFDIICSVVSRRDVQIDRMVTTRAMTLAQAEARLAAQMPVEEKARRSHYVIRNDGSPEELKAQAVELTRWLKSKSQV